MGGSHLKLGVVRGIVLTLASKFDEQTQMLSKTIAT